MATNQYVPIVPSDTFQDWNQMVKTEPSDIIWDTIKKYDNEFTAMRNNVNKIIQVLTTPNEDDPSSPENPDDPSHPEGPSDPTDSNGLDLSTAFFTPQNYKEQGDEDDTAAIVRAINAAKESGNPHAKVLLTKTYIIGRAVILQNIEMAGGALKLTSANDYYGFVQTKDNAYLHDTDIIVTDARTTDSWFGGVIVTGRNSIIERVTFKCGKLDELDATSLLSNAGMAISISAGSMYNTIKNCRFEPHFKEDILIGGSFVTIDNCLFEQHPYQYEELAWELPEGKLTTGYYNNAIKISNYCFYPEWSREFNQNEQYDYGDKTKREQMVMSNPAGNNIQILNCIMLNHTDNQIDSFTGAENVDIIGCYIGGQCTCIEIKSKPILFSLLEGEYIDYDFDTHQIVDMYTLDADGVTKKLLAKQKKNFNLTKLQAVLNIREKSSATPNKLKGEKLHDNVYRISQANLISADAPLAYLDGVNIEKIEDFLNEYFEKDCEENEYPWPKRTDLSCRNYALNILENTYSGMQPDLNRVSIFSETINSTTLANEEQQRKYFKQNALTYLQENAILYPREGKKYFYFKKHLTKAEIMEGFISKCFTPTDISYSERLLLHLTRKSDNYRILDSTLIGYGILFDNAEITEVDWESRNTLISNCYMKNLHTVVGDAITYKPNKVRYCYLDVGGQPMLGKLQVWDETNPKGVRADPYTDEWGTDLIQRYTDDGVTPPENFTVYTNIPDSNRRIRSASMKGATAVLKVGSHDCSINHCYIDCGNSTFLGSVTKGIMVSDSIIRNATVLIPDTTPQGLSLPSVRQFVNCKIVMEPSKPVIMGAGNTITIFSGCHIKCGSLSNNFGVYSRWTEISDINTPESLIITGCYIEASQASLIRIQNGYMKDGNYYNFDYSKSNRNIQISLTSCFIDIRNSTPHSIIRPVHMNRTETFVGEDGTTNTRPIIFPNVKVRMIGCLSKSKYRGVVTTDETAPWDIQEI